MEHGYKVTTATEKLNLGDTVDESLKTLAWWAAGARKSNWMLL